MRKGKKQLEKNIKLYDNRNKYLRLFLIILAQYLPSGVHEHGGMSIGLKVKCPDASQIRTITDSSSLCETEQGLPVIRPNNSLLWLPKLAPHPVHNIPAQQYLSHT